jgi:probable H4MPT-linked C1 transfer pathway protein
MSRTAIGLDVGGANLKAAHSGGTALTLPLPLWKQPSCLAGRVADLLARLPPADAVALTMTGELCDCFVSKREGVAFILDAVARAAGGLPVSVWATTGEFLRIEGARAVPLEVAAANWLALATFAGRWARAGPSLLVDVGSTSCDVIPLVDGVPAPVGRTDPARLRSSELVYVGARRTPACALLGTEGAAELFATVHDALLVLGLVPEDPGDTDTADGRPATAEFAHARLARMLCADLETSSAGERISLAQRVCSRLVEAVSFAVRHVAAHLPGKPRTVILSGSGEAVARMAVAPLAELAGAFFIPLGQELGAELSRAACAYAVARLLVEGGQ